MSEARININGVRLTQGQSMMIRCAVESFAMALESDFDELANEYRKRIDEIRELLEKGTGNG